MYDRFIFDVYSNHVILPTPPSTSAAVARHIGKISSPFS